MKRNLSVIAALTALLFLTNVSFSQPCNSSGTCNTAGAIKRVKNTRIGNYEYVVFDIKKPLNTGYSYSVSSILPPFIENPSGNSISINGNQFKKITFENISWMCPIKEIFSLPNAAIKDIKKVTQFEGKVEYVVGHSASSTYVGTYSYSLFWTRKVVMKFKRC